MKPIEKVMAKTAIIPTKDHLSILPTDQEVEYPALALRTGVLFPGEMLTIQVGRKENLRLIRESREQEKEFIAAYAVAGKKPEDSKGLHQVGVTAVVRDCREGAGRSLTVTIEGLERVVLGRIVRETPYLAVTASRIKETTAVSKDLGKKIDSAIALVGEITALDPSYSPEQLYVLKMNQGNPSILADRASAMFRFPLDAKQELLSAVKLSKRYDRLLLQLNNELSRVATIHSIELNVKKNIKEEQKNHFLRLQLHEIRKQLGDDFSEEKEAAQLRQAIKSSTDLPSEVIARATIEVDRLSQLSSASAEYGVTKTYLDWVLSLPWGKYKPDDYSIADVERIISSDYFGPRSIKEQILQRISVRKLLGGINEGPTLCLVGAPGTGKASLARAVAKAMGKEFIRISVGGISSVAEIKGSSRTYLGAMPGKIMRAMRDAGTCDPVVLIEDIDYFNMENDSSVNMALLEVIDTRKNGKFLDNYIGIPFDLSKVVFISSVRAYEEIPEQFVPRFEIVDLPGYIEKEKVVISKKYMIPKLLQKHGLTRSELKITDKILLEIINTYTMEAGLLTFSQQIEKICRKIALAKSSKKQKSWTINEKNLESYLGPSIFIREKAEKRPEIGTVAGLAWTGSGGDLMFIEGLKMKGEGQIITTGSLGEVMRESILAAHSYVRSKADMLGIDFGDFSQFDIHIHFPSGAIPKDGPSAGVAVCLVIASVMAERPIRHDMAMTGEVTLRGKVLPVGGIKEKISAAYRAGILNVALPKENKKDLKELPKEILRKSKFTFIDRVDELFEVGLLDFTPSAFTLEKIFAEEIEKAQSKAKEEKKKKTAEKRKKTTKVAKKKTSKTTSKKKSR